MLPNITNAKVKLAFPLDNVYRASFCTDIEAPGLIQYHHLLVVYEPGKQPALCIGAEWGRLDPMSEEDPVLGYFDADGHTNCGSSYLWCDEALFILQALRLARDVLEVKNVKLVEGETWALSEMQNKLELMRATGGICLYDKEYELALFEAHKIVNGIASNNLDS